MADRPSAQTMTSETSLSTRETRRLNRSRVLSALRFQALAGRAEVAAFTGLTEAAVSRITRELIDAGVLTEETPPAADGRSVGRPLIKLSLVGGAAHVLAFEIAASAQSVSLIDMRGERIGHTELSLLDGLKPDVALRRAADAGLKLIEKGGISIGTVVGAGVSIAGAVDPDSGEVLSAPNIGWFGVPVASPLEKRLRMPVRVESRASALLLAEHRLGVAKHVRNVLLINLALGIGGAIMMDGRLMRGRNHAAGLIGHMPMPGATGLCVCTRIGCLDTLASGRAILSRLDRLSTHSDLTRHGTSDAQTLRAVVQEADQGDIAAMKVLRDAGKHLGTALQWSGATLQPDLIVIAGEPSRSVAYLEGVKSSYSDPQAAPLAVSGIANEVAAAELALDAFVYTKGLDIGRQ